MKKLRILVIAVFATALISLPAFVNGVSFAQNATQPGLCAGANLDAPGTAADGDCQNINEGASENVNELVTLIINIFSWVVGVVAVIMIIYGGFQYITAAGDTGKVGNAKNTILYALIGLVIVALAQVIVRFVLGNITGLAE